MENFTCTECGKHYPQHKNLRRHYLDKHSSVLVTAPPSLKTKKNYSFPCNLCDAKFSNKYNLKSHVSKVHFLCEFASPSIKCSMCTVELNTNKGLIEHLEKTHGVVSMEEVLLLESFTMFKEWKEKIEKKTISKYIKIRSKTSKDGDTKHYFGCNRSGKFNSKGNNERHLKKQGSCKINANCPASIIAIKKMNGNVEVRYCDTHVGHNADLQHVSLSSSEKMAIAGDILNNVPYEKILDRIRESVEGNTLSRIHVIEKRDLHNIEQEFNLNEAVKHKNDGTSVEAWVLQDKKSEEPSVLYYKPQGLIDPMFPDLLESDFVLIIMNSFQKEALKQFGTDCICVDGTHGPYSFEIISLLVLDELRQGFPCAFMISNRTDQTVMAIFYSKIKEQIGVFKSSVFMSDMAESFYNAWIKVMGNADKRLFCSWHVDRAWRKNINSKIQNKEKQAEAYKMLRSMLQQDSVEAFENLFPVMLQKMSGDLELEKFGIYLKENYSKNTVSWALCYRIHCGLNTNMHIESMHRTLKHIYFQGKTVQRLDKTLHILMKYVRDKIFDRLIAFCLLRR